MSTQLVSYRTSDGQALGDELRPGARNRACVQQEGFAEYAVLAQVVQPQVGSDAEAPDARRFPGTVPRRWNFGCGRGHGEITITVPVSARS